MEMKLQFPAEHGQILEYVEITHKGNRENVYFSTDAIITFTLHTPDGAFTYTIDNARKTLTTESDSPFLA